MRFQTNTGAWIHKELLNEGSKITILGHFKIQLLRCWMEVCWLSDSKVAQPKINLLHLSDAGSVLNEASWI